MKHPPPPFMCTQPLPFLVDKGSVRAGLLDWLGSIMTDSLIDEKIPTAPEGGGNKMHH